MLHRPWAWFLFALLMLVPPAVLLGLRSQVAVPEDYGPMPSFSLVSHAGAPFTNADLAGDVVVLDFIFTRCPDVCPLMTTQMVALQRALPARPFGGPRLQLVSVSVDPMHDTPPVLQAYAERYGADLGPWTFLTGSPGDISALSEGLAQALVARPTDDEAPDITHSQRLLLIDPSGHVRGFFQTDAAGLDGLVAAIEGIAAE
ncbi:MAG: SCO family protein [Myxococcota bacterium]|nr:SCO family protein [Myxococcota bacterium]